jgi:chromate reductase, NAD(P)H dehydrogenase (quinone)
VVPVRVLGINGSLQRESSNAALLDTFAAVASPTDDVTLAVSIADIPHFLPDETDSADVAASVRLLREQVATADAVVFASPEYAHSLPGSLKNALDWIVGSGELYEKPVAVTCASRAPNRGQLGRGALEQPLRGMGALIVDSRTVVIDDADAQASAVLELLRAAVAARTVSG